jgi:hypothetical protein
MMQTEGKRGWWRGQIQGQKESGCRAEKNIGEITSLSASLSDLS